MAPFQWTFGSPSAGISMLTIACWSMRTIAGSLSVSVMHGTGSDCPQRALSSPYASGPASTTAVTEARKAGIPVVGLNSGIDAWQSLGLLEFFGQNESVAGTAVSVGAGAVGLAADAAIGTARITGKAVGAAADAVLPQSDGEPAP